MKEKIQLVSDNVPAIRITPSFGKVIGQASVKKKLEFYLKTNSSSAPFPTMLFTGSHGLGKTYVAKKVAVNLGRRLVEVNCGLINVDKDLVEGVLMQRVLGNSPVTIFLDEAHRLSGDITTILLTLLNPNKENRNEIHHKGWDILFDMNKINVILATTDAYKIFRPLLDRCERIYFESYSSEELVEMLEMYCPNVKIRCNKLDIADACRGRGRDTFVLAQKINRYLDAKGNGVLSEAAWNEIKSIFDIYPMGLNRQEVELIQIIANNGPISSANIALTMMINVDNVESEIEVRPRELGLIQSTTRGRVLTDAGKEYIEKV